MVQLKTKNDSVASDLVVRLPEAAFTRSGISFSPNQDIWQWTDGPFRVYLDFRKILLPASIPLDSFKRTMLVFAKRNSASHLTNLFGVFVHFLNRRTNAEPLITINATEVSNYGANLEAHQKWRVGTLNVLLQKWVGLGLAGVEPDCTEFLREIRKPGNEKGAAVRTRNPISGPFSEDEYTSLYKAVDTAYGKEEIPQWVAVLTRLLFACGGRISQYASLKIEDVIESSGAYSIKLPQVKTRDVHSRSTFKEFDLSLQTGKLILDYIDNLKCDGYEDESPLFPQSVVMSYGPRESYREDDDLFHDHCVRSALSNAFRNHVQPISPPSSRLNFESVPVSTQRFRYTFGTRLAEEGASKIVIADRLGHVDLQNVDVYFEASPKIVENIDKAMGATLAPLSRAFMGRLIEDESQSTARGAPGSRIIDFRISTEPAGSCSGCGKNCSFSKPTACYTCFKFEPWIDAPHDKILLRLEADRKRFEGDERMAAITDDAIRAVREVIAECASAKEQRREGGST